MTKRKHPLIPFVAVSVMLLALIYIAANTGSLKIGFIQLFKGLFIAYDETAWVIFDMRFPRVIVSLLSGAALAVSGTLFQAVMRNPLADPGIMGISAGAGFASAAVLVFFPSLFFVTPVFAFIGGAVSCALVYLLSWKRGLSPLRVILVGVAVNALFMGLADSLSFMNSGNVAVIQIGMKTWVDVRGMAWYVPAGLAAALLLCGKCDLLALEDETLTGLGVSVNRLRVVISCAAVLLAAAVSAYVGVLSFVGLIVPHIGRILVGSGHKKLIPFSILSGAFTVLLADTVGRTVIAPAEIPATVVMAVIGGPFFIFLLRTEGKSKFSFKAFVKPLFIALGFLTFAIGTIGIFLPVLPTTPLYLVALFCFARGSSRFHGWFVSTKLYKRHLESFVKSRAMTMKKKLVICVPVSVMMGLAFYFLPNWHGRVAIAAALCLKWYYFLFKIKTQRGKPYDE
jgi:iron complex transport system permease protein